MALPRYKVRRLMFIVVMAALILGAPRVPGDHPRIGLALIGVSFFGLFLISLRRRIARSAVARPENRRGVNRCVGPDFFVRRVRDHLRFCSRIRHFRVLDGISPAAPTSNGCGPVQTYVW